MQRKSQPGSHDPAVQGKRSRENLINEAFKSSRDNLVREAFAPSRSTPTDGTEAAAQGAMPNPAVSADNSQEHMQGHFLNFQRRDALESMLLVGSFW